MYAKFAAPLVSQLKRTCNSEADCEDAVAEAFVKLMYHKKPEAYGDNLPETEKSWFWTFYWQARSYLSHLKERFAFDTDILRDVVRIGLPAMIEQGFMRLGSIIFTRAVSGLGTVMFATHNICMNIQAMSMMIGQAFAVSATTLMGQSLGKRRYDMAVIYMRYTRRLGLFVAAGVGLMVMTFRSQIIGIYNTTPEVVAAGSAVLLGAGDTRFSAMVTAFTVIVVRSGLAVFTIRYLNMGLWGAWIAMLSDQILRTVLMYYRYSTGKWAHMALTHAMEREALHPEES